MRIWSRYGVWAIIFGVGGVGGVGAGEEGVILEVAADGAGMYRSVQAAVDAAPSGALVRIGAGVYDGPVRITKPLTLEGAGWDKSRLRVDWYDLHALVDDPSRVPEERRDRFEALIAGVKTADGEKYGKLLEELVAEFGARPTVTVVGTEGVAIKNLRITMTGVVRDGGWEGAPMVLIDGSEVEVRGCAFAGSPVEGVHIRGASVVDMRTSLVAGIRATGIDVETLEPSKVRIAECKIRNCGYSGVTVKGTGESVVENCRIAKMDYHGIRYDDASPQVLRNLFADVNRAGIYADGTTHAVVRHNLFHGSGVWAGPGNRDVVEENTFVFTQASPKRSAPDRAISIGEDSQPTLRKNVIAGFPLGVTIGGDGDELPELEGNLFDVTDMPVGRWVNEKNMSGDATKNSSGRFVTVALPDGNTTKRVEFVDRAQGDYRVVGNAEVGARGYSIQTKEWPELDEERDLLDRLAEARSDRDGAFQTGVKGRRVEGE